jgi:hypothetical protein
MAPFFKVMSLVNRPLIKCPSYVPLGGLIFMTPPDDHLNSSDCHGVRLVTLDDHARRRLGLHCVIQLLEAWSRVNGHITTITNLPG